MAGKAVKPLKGKALDREIERLYYRLAQGRQISVLKIGSLYQLATEHYGKGVDLEAAVTLAISVYCEPAAKNQALVDAANEAIELQKPIEVTIKG